MKADIAIIGGSGVGERLRALGGKAVHIGTPFGMARGNLVDHEGVSLLLISRHSVGHATPPHQVNYRAIVDAIRRMGVKACISTAAVGSLRPEWGPGTMVACSDFLDLSDRQLTMFDRQVVHTDFSEPFANVVREALVAEANGPIKCEGVYLSLNGPRYETAREIQTFRGLGADLVGMTVGTEAVLMRESGVPYGCLAIVTNLAAGISATPLSHQEVVEEMERSGERAVELLLRVARRLAK